MNKLLAVLVNYGEEQLSYLQKVVNSLKDFEKYDVTIIVNSNIPIQLNGVDKVNVITLDNYQYLPLTCRKVIWDNKDAYDIFLYGENDHLFLEHHIDKHLEYSKLLPKNRIAGLIQYEESEVGRFYPAYHRNFDWDYRSIEVYGGKTFAHFNNVHQASFVLTKEQLKGIGKRINFIELVKDKPYTRSQKAIRKIMKKLGWKMTTHRIYSIKCKVNTDIYQYAGLKKLICISEFEDNIIHHLPNLYITGTSGRQQLSASEVKMTKALTTLLKNE